MKTRKTKIFAVMVITLFAIGMMGGASNANVQSRPSAPSLVNKTASDFFQLIRNMESPTQAMGLNATVDSTGKETSSSNNIDVHMMKNTEWGAIAMLSASAYGNCPSGQWSATDTTTGNKYGLYQMGGTGNKGEYMATSFSGTTSSLNANIRTAEAKYYNLYTAPFLSGGAKTGDATAETSGWKGSSVPCGLDTTNPVTARGYLSYGTSSVSGQWYIGLFFGGGRTTGTTTANNAPCGSNSAFISSRVAVTCGERILI